MISWSLLIMDREYSGDAGFSSDKRFNEIIVNLKYQYLTHSLGTAVRQYKKKC